jgi:membrane-bound lytic murein transglycosylase D
VVLSRPVDLRRVAEWADTTIDEIQSLNPELRRWTTPVRATDYELRVPPGTSDEITARLADAAGVELASFKWYIVKRGDTLPLIAKKLQVSRNDLADANYMLVSARIAAGQKLIVPREATALMAANSDRPVPVTEARRTVSETGTLAASTESNRVKVIYQVQRGDTLTSIAQGFRTTVAAIKTWNPRIPGERLAAGQRLTVYRVGT